MTCYSLWFLRPDETGWGPCLESRRMTRFLEFIVSLLIVVAIVAIILLLTGGFVQSLNFLLWVGIVLLVIAVIAFLARSISGRRG